MEFDPICIGELAIRRDEILDALRQWAKVGDNQHTRTGGTPDAVPLQRTGGENLHHHSENEQGSPGALLQGTTDKIVSGSRQIVGVSRLFVEFEYSVKLFIQREYGPLIAKLEWVQFLPLLLTRPWCLVGRLEDFAPSVCALGAVSTKESLRSYRGELLQR